MTYKDTVEVAPLEPDAMGTTETGQAKPQTLVVGPLSHLRADEDARDQWQ